MIEFQAETWRNARDELAVVGFDHYREVHRRDDFNLDLGRYDALDDAGMFHVTTARRSGALVGYSTVIVAHHLHSKDQLWGMVDAYWIEHDSRGPRVAMNLIQATEDGLAMRFGRISLHAEDPLGNGSNRLFPFMGWRETARTYVKHLGAN